MAFDTFDEGINPGGVRSKNEIRTLICYLFTTVNQPMSKDTVINALLEKGLSNYFEASSCFDDLYRNGNIAPTEDNPKLFFTTANGDIISHQLEDTLPLTVRERACFCALTLLEQEKSERENKVTIEKTDNGYYINLSVSGGDMELMNMRLYMPDSDHARMVKKNFYKNPHLVYKIMIASLTRNKDLVNDALKDLGNLS